MRKEIKIILGGVVVVLALVGLISITAIQSVKINPSQVGDITARSNNFETSDQIISVENANQMRDIGSFLLDVRTVEEWNEAHIPGAVLIPLDELQTRISELPENEDIVIYCRSGNRSRQALNLLLSVGYSTMYSMEGGINDWIDAGYPVE